MRRALLFWLTLWSTAFGVCEGAVVVYLRRLCYPGQPPTGPLLPLPEIDASLLRTEMARELGTLVMLLGVAMLAERRPLRRFAVFAFCFGMWDLVYYATLHVAIGWPASLMTWDVLFLVPAPWSSPVLAPVLVSLALIGASALVLARQDDAPSPLRPRDWLVQSACGGVILWAFLWNAEAANGAQPLGHFPWWLFLPALGIAVGCFLCRWFATRRAA
ncbi:MAG TPA: hypothetical protein VFY71_05085 [Planctomycetota bacterium]|nr:hypothetical protein [Planctomycetota bacterium]